MSEPFIVHRGKVYINQAEVEDGSVSSYKPIANQDPYQPAIAWRRGLANLPSRDPVEVDVMDGRAEYVFSGPYHLAEGASIVVRDGKVLWSGGKSRPSQDG